MHDVRNDPGRFEAVEDKLDADGGDEEAEDLLGDQHAAFVELGPDLVRPAEHHYVYQQDHPEDADGHGENSERVQLGRDRHQADDADRVEQVRHGEGELSELQGVFPCR